MSDIDIDGSQVTLHRGTTVDSGGVGKGLAADLAVEFALKAGALGALVEVGGDVRVGGVSPRSDSWRLAIEDPSIQVTGFLWWSCAPKDLPPRLLRSDASRSGHGTPTTSSAL